MASGSGAWLQRCSGKSIVMVGWRQVVGLAIEVQ